MKSFILSENLQPHLPRIFIGAFYGFLSGLVFALVSGVVDAITYPDLPIHIMWTDIVLRALGLGLGLALGGAVTGYSDDTAQAILTGAATLALLGLLVSIFQSPLSLSMRLITFVALVLPIAAACFPVAWMLRWLIKRQGRLSDKSGFAWARGSALSILIVLLVSATPAVFTRMSGTAVRAISFVHESFQAAAAGDQEVLAQLRISNASALQAHLGQPYALSYAKSKTSTEGYDVTLWFEDGYTATCELITYGGQKPYLRACVEGTEIKSSQ